MLLDVNHRVIDVDAKGTSGRGTLFRMEITVYENGQRHYEEHDYSLLDLIEKKVDLQAITAPFHERKRAYDRAQDEADKAEKKAAADERKQSVKADPALDEILTAAIAANPKPVEEFRSGKEKALNAVVGFVMKEIKAKGIQVADAAFTVNTLLKQKLA